jgi:hypothetical protein
LGGPPPERFSDLAPKRISKDAQLPGVIRK